MLFREDAFGNSIPKVEKFLDIHPGIDEKVQRVHERRFSRRPFLDENSRIDLFVELLHMRVQNCENFRSGFHEVLRRN